MSLIVPPMGANITQGDRVSSIWYMFFKKLYENTQSNASPTYNGLITPWVKTSSDTKGFTIKGQTVDVLFINTVTGDEFPLGNIFMNSNPTETNQVVRWNELNTKANINQKLDMFGTPEDNTNLNATANYHGLMPKLPGNTMLFLRGDGTWAVP